MITISVDTKEAARRLSDVQRRHLPFALSVALNNTARDMQEALSGETRVFDRPKPLTRSGTYIVRATKQRLIAEVGLKQRGRGGPVNEYLQAQVLGGRRPMKRSELSLARAGVLPTGKQTRPGSGARLDAHGNMSRGQIVQILSFFKARGARTGQKTAAAKLERAKARRRAAVDYFAVPDGTPGLASGVWQRIGGRVQPVLIFIDPPAYRQRYAFGRVAQASADTNLARHAEAAMRRALATAR